MSSIHSAHSPKTSKISLFAIYAAGLLQGFLLESIPASSTIIHANLGGSSDGYGLLFIGQLIGVFLGTLLGANACKFRFLGKNLTKVLAISVLIQALSQSGLIADTLFPHSIQAYYFQAYIIGAFLFGLGFGISASPVNNLPGILFPNKPDAALLVMHSLIGIGLAASPWLIGYSIGQSTWPAPQIAMLVSGIIIFALLLLSPPVVVQTSDNETPRSSEHSKNKSLKALFKTPVLWVFMLIAVSYALAEGTLNNWAVLYLTEFKLFSPTQATQVLSAFWSALAIGRMGMAALLIIIPASWVWIGFPLLVILSFILLPTITPHNTVAATWIYIIAGLGCSAAFPLSIRFAIQSFEDHSEFMASFMTAALMLGICTGSYALGPLQKQIPLQTLLQASALWPVLMIGLSLWTLLNKKRDSTSA